MTSPLDWLRATAETGARDGWLPAALGYGFVVNALVCACLLGPLLGSVGPLVVTKRLAFFAQAIGQAAITGVALGVLLGEPTDRPYVSLFAFCTLFALALLYTRHRTRMPADTLIAVFLSVSLAVGACLLPVVAARADAHLIEAILFGSILTVGDFDIAVLAGIGVVGALLLGRSFNAMAFASLNAELAEARGVRVVVLEYAFVLFLTAVTVAAVKIVGAILVEALLIIPAAAGRSLARSLRGWLGWSAGLCSVSCVAGILGPLVLDVRVPSGAAIVLVAAGGFGLAVAARAARRES